MKKFSILLAAAALVISACTPNDDSLVFPPVIVEELDNTITEVDADIDATTMTADELEEALAGLLVARKISIVLMLAPDASAEMFGAIRNALYDSNLPDGSIELTIAGASVVPELFLGDKYVETVITKGDSNYAVDKLQAIHLLDVKYIGAKAFLGCTNLTEFTAPKARRVQEYAFMATALKSVDLPKASVIGFAAFANCDYLTSAKLPLVTSLGGQAFLRESVSSSYSLTLELTSKDVIVVGQNIFNTAEESYQDKVKMVLNNDSKVDFVSYGWEHYNFTSESVEYQSAN